MQTSQFLQGRTITIDDIDHIRCLIKDHPDWHRTRISKQLCGDWDWVNENGALKDMAARTLLRKLDAQGLISLPAPVRSANNNYRHQGKVNIDLDQTPIGDRLSELRPLRIVPVTDQQQANLFRGMLQAHHYLGYTGPVGENIKYLVFDRHERLLAALLFGAAAWQVACRDQWIGWSQAARREGLSRVANNMRFLILPWVQVPHLASHLLAQVSRRLGADWQHKYGHPIVLLETFVETDRFRGTCYRAANWIPVGDTTGRSRNDRYTNLCVPIKSVWLQPLHKQCQRLLSQTDGHSHHPPISAALA
jgi:hypothetical protein